MAAPSPRPRDGRRRRPLLRAAALGALGLAGVGCAGWGGAPGEAAEPPPPAVAAPPPQPALEPYTVRAGDTLWAIARRRGTTVEALAGWNALDDPDRIQAGRVLRVPPAGGAPDPGAAAGVPEDRPARAAAAPTPEPAGVPGARDPAAVASAASPAGPAESALAAPAAEAPLPAPAEASVAEPSRAAEAPSAPPPPSPARLGRARSAVEDAEERFWGAEYERALAAAEDAHALVAEAAGEEARTLRARALLVAGMALGALGDEAAARERFTRALGERPGIALPEPPPPRLGRLFEAARAEAQAASP